MLNETVVVLDENKIELRQVDVPEVGKDMVKVKIAYVALCATDATW